MRPRREIRQCGLNGAARKQRLQVDAQVRVDDTVGRPQPHSLDRQLEWVGGIRFKRQCSFKTTAAEITGHRDIRPRRVDNFCLEPNAVERGGAYGYTVSVEPRSHAQSIEATRDRDVAAQLAGEAHAQGAAGWL